MYVYILYIYIIYYVYILYIHILYIVFLLIVQLIPLHNIAAFINICRFLNNVVKLCLPLSKLNLPTLRKGCTEEWTQRNK